jgi:hypothetical protein
MVIIIFSPDRLYEKKANEIMCKIKSEKTLMYSLDLHLFPAALLHKGDRPREIIHPDRNFSLF